MAEWLIGDRHSRCWSPHLPPSGRRGGRCSSFSVWGRVPVDTVLVPATSLEVLWDPAGCGPGREIRGTFVRTPLRCAGLPCPTWISSRRPWAAPLWLVRF